VSLPRLFATDLLPATIQTSLLMGAFIIAYQSITFWYPKFLATIHRAPLPFLLALDVGGIVGAAMWVAPYLVGALQDLRMAGWRSRRSWAAASSAPVC
jgi:hypothetical protein